MSVGLLTRQGAHATKPDALSPEAQTGFHIFMGKARDRLGAASRR
jgi:hypothetical protein